MKILTHVDLGKAFEDLKNTLIETEKQVKVDEPTVFDTGLKYANAYGRLSGAVLCHIAGNTDTSYHFLDDALKTAENSHNDSPIYEQTHFEDEKWPDIIQP